VLVLRIPAALDVPVLDGPDDVGLVSRAELELHLIARGRVRVGQEQVKATRAGLPALDVLHHQLAQAEQAGVRDDPLLEPLLAEDGMALKADGLRALVVDHRPTVAASHGPSWEPLPPLPPASGCSRPTTELCSQTSAGLSLVPAI
jgi:hypothetical protein